jgi:hypothetical protein
MSDEFAADGWLAGDLVAAELSSPLTRTHERRGNQRVTTTARYGIFMIRFSASS